MKKIILAIGGASGSIYAKLLMDRLSQIPHQFEEVAIVMSDNAKLNWKIEIKDESYASYGFNVYDKNDFFAPFASGSAKFDTMIVAPCSMGLLARIAQGHSSDLTTRAADVILKERRKLILVTRETPLNLIHIDNMRSVTQAGGIICPATPSFYSDPKSIDELVLTVVDRVLDLAGLDIDSFRWGN